MRNIPVYLFVFLVSAEYFGLGSYIPIYKSLPIPLALSFLLLIYVIFTYPISESFKYKQTVYYAIFLMLTALSMLHGLIQSYAIDPTKTQVGYFIFLLLASALIDKRTNLSLFINAFVIIHVAMIFINIDKLGQARLGSFKASYFLGDGNDFAWSINVAFPMCMYMLLRSNKIIYKGIYISFAAVLLLGIIGTQSRGATLALGGGFLYYFFFITKSKPKGIVILLIAALGVVAVAPENYFSRMETLTTYEEDTSAMGRIKAWGHATEMAIDHPILGVGAGSFNSAYGRYYRTPGDPVRWISTHSVYFKILAEYSFLGVFIYLMIIINNLKTNTKTSKTLINTDEDVEIDYLWPLCLNWSIISCSIAAMFLSGVDYPHLFLLTGLSVSAALMANKMSTSNSQKIFDNRTPWEKYCDTSNCR